MKGKIFNAQEVQAIIAGRKTQFRELINTKQSFIEPSQPYGKCPYQVGQKIFCKEVWGIEKYGENGEYEDSYGEPTRTLICYKNDGDKTPITNHWNAARLMPQWASRLTLLITGIKVERLGDISKEDAIAEAPQYSIIQPFGNKNPIDFFKTLWNLTHKKPEEKFEASPFVWVVSFEVVK